MTVPNNVLVIGGGILLVVFVAFFFFFKNYCDKRLAVGFKSIKRRFVKDITKLNAISRGDMIREQVGHSRHPPQKSFEDDSVAEAGGADNDYAEYERETDE